MTEHDAQPSSIGDLDAEYEDGFEDDAEHTNARLDAMGQGLIAGSATDKVVVWDFTVLMGAAEAEARSALTDWVTEILQGWYDLVGEDQVSGAEYRRLRVPACWAQHRDVVIELGWLAQTWLHAYRHEDGGPHAAAEWHTRFLPAAVERVRRTSTACGCSYQHKSLA